MNPGGMTALDIIIVVVALGSVFMGIRKGVISQIGSLGGLVMAILVSRALGGRFAEAMAAGSLPGMTPVAEEGVPTYFQLLLAHAILFVACYLTVKVVVHFCKSITNALSLGFVDRLLGGVFSLFKWMLLLSLLLNFWLVLKPETEWASLSTLGNHHAVEFVVALAPQVLGWAMAS